MTPCAVVLLMVLTCRTAVAFASAPGVERDKAGQWRAACAEGVEAFEPIGAALVAHVRARHPDDPRGKVEPAEIARWIRLLHCGSYDEYAAAAKAAGLVLDREMLDGIAADARAMLQGAGRFRADADAEEVVRAIWADRALRGMEVRRVRVDGVTTGSTMIAQVGLDFPRGGLVGRVSIFARAGGRLREDEVAEMERRGDCAWVQFRVERAGGCRGAFRVLFVWSAQAGKWAPASVALSPCDAEELAPYPLM